MLRSQLKESLSVATKAKDRRAVATLRLILAALKDRDIAARAKGILDGIGDDDILGMLQSMIRHRHETIALYEHDGRLELAEQEAEEIDVIERFLPEQVADEEMRDAVIALIAELKAANLKDVGRIMATLKERYAGRMDFARASIIVKKQLS
jgi:uncharacterized protein